MHDDEDDDDDDEDASTTTTTTFARHLGAWSDVLTTRAVVTQVRLGDTGEKWATWARGTTTTDGRRDDQDALGTIARDARDVLATARRAVPRDAPGSVSVLEACAAAARDAARATRVSVRDARGREGTLEASTTCGLVDGLPNGVVVTRETVSARDDDDDDDVVDVVVLVVSESTFEREETVETLAEMCARARGDGTDVVVVCEGERTSTMEETSTRVGIPLAEALDTTRLLDGLENDSTVEAAASLAWADASAREREWVSAFAKRVRDAIVRRAENIIKRYQPARDVVVFWDTVSGDVREAESTSSSSTLLAKHAANHMLGKIINGAVSGIPSFAVSSASALAERHLESNPELEASRLKTLIYADATKSFAAGTVLSLGGPLAAPLTMLPALVMYFTIRMRLCVAIAVMGARDDAAATLRPSTVAAALLCFFGSNAADIMAARPTVEQFELDDLMHDLETEDAFRAADVDARVDGGVDGAPRKSLGEVLNEKLRRLGAEAEARTNDAIRAVLESGSRAVREAQKDAAKASEHAREFVRRHGGTPGEANRAAESAFERHLPISLYERMSAGVFTAENMPILVAELVPAISSYLTIRAATTAMTCMLPESVAAAEQIAKEAAVEEQETVEQAPESWDETAKKHLTAAAESTKRAAVAVGEATTNAFSELNRSFSRMFSAKKK